MAFGSILIFGCGKMAGAMVEGWIRGGMDPSRLTVVNRSQRELPEGVRQFSQWPDGEEFDAVLLGVKPQMLGDLAGGINTRMGSGKIVLSLLAGVDLAHLREVFPTAKAVVRVMPNLAVALGKSPIALAESGLSAAEKPELVDLLAPLGAPEWISEDSFDLVTALAGSGPGFVYRFIDALADGAGSLGLERDQAERLAVAMVDGAAALASASPYSAGELAARVASPGGMTQKGLDVLDEGKALNNLVKDCLRAARDRGAELAELAKAQD